MATNKIEKNDDMIIILGSCYFSSKSIINATVENVKEAGRSCEFLGYDINTSRPVLNIDGSMYYLIYEGSTCGVQGDMVLQTITLKKVDAKVKIDSENKKLKSFFRYFRKAN